MGDAIGLVISRTSRMRTGMAVPWLRRNGRVISSTCAGGSTSIARHGTTWQGCRPRRLTLERGRRCEPHRRPRRGNIDATIRSDASPSARHRGIKRSGPCNLPVRAMSHQRDLVQMFERNTTMIRKAWAVWKGGIKDGGGTISTETGVLNEAPYGFKSRFENGKGTNPEELIGAAHAGCFSMALSLMLGQAGLTPERIETHAAVTLDKIGDGFEITASHLTVTAKIPGATQASF